MDEWEGTAGRRAASPSQVAAAVVLLVLLGAVVVLADRTGSSGGELEVGVSDELGIDQNDLPEPPPTFDTPPDPQPPSPEPVGEWRELPEAPIHRRSDAVALWTGVEVLVWGGQEGDWHSDGAGYDPARDAWRELALAPRPAAPETSAAWTGRELIAVGVEGGAALSYDPEVNVWRVLPEPPVTFEGATVSVWDGTEVVTIGRAAADDAGDLPEHSAVIAYDPSRDSWRQLPETPLAEHGLFPSAAAVGDQVALLGAVENDDGHRHLAITAYDRAADDWTAPDPSPFSTTTSTWLVGMAASDERVGVAGSLLRGASWRFQGGWWSPDEGWRRLPGPIPEDHAMPQTAALPSGLLVWSGTQGQEGWLLTSDGWQPLPEGPIAPRNGASTVWTGQDLFVWGGRQGPRAHDDGMRWRDRNREVEYCCSP